MSEDTDPTAIDASPLEWTRGVLRRTWNDVVSVYYANTMIWRLFKSGALVFLGLFAWSGANLLLSYRPEWGVLYYVMAYGFVLLVWGPLTHFVIVPLVIRLRRSGAGGVKRVLARHGSKINLAVFFTIVLVLGTAPLGVMTFEFQVPSGGPGDGTVPTKLECTKSEGVIHCHVTTSAGIDRVVVTSGGETVLAVEDPPYDFDLKVSDLERVDGDRQFTVDLRDENDRTVRRYIRRAELIPGSVTARAVGSSPPRGGYWWPSRARQPAG